MEKKLIWINMAEISIIHRSVRIVSFNVIWESVTSTIYNIQRINKIRLQMAKIRVIEGFSQSMASFTIQSVYLISLSYAQLLYTSNAMLIISMSISVFSFGAGLTKWIQSSSQTRSQSWVYSLIRHRNLIENTNPQNSKLLNISIMIVIHRETIRIHDIVLHHLWSTLFLFGFSNAGYPIESALFLYSRWT